MRWPKGPSHLALNPPFVLFLCFPFFAFHKKKPVNPPPPKRAFLFIFLCLPLFLFSLLWPPPFPLSLCLSLLFFLFFRPFFLFLISVSGSCFCFCSVCLLFQDVLLFLFFCLLSCLVLDHNIQS